MAIILVTAASLAVGSPANAAAFTPGGHGFLDTGGVFTQIDVPGAGSTSAYGINNAGQIVGYYFAGLGILHGFLDSGGSFTQIEVPGAVDTQAHGINNAGQIVGWSSTSTGMLHGFLYSGGSFTQIDVPGAGSTFAYGINDAGQIVGASVNGIYPHGFLYSGGSFTQIEVPGAIETTPHGINNSGQIVGLYVDSANIQHGFLDTGGIFTTIDVPGTFQTSPHGINDAGQIVGYFTGEHGFLDTGGIFTTIDVPSANGTSAYGINNAGQIVGNTFVAFATGDPHFTTYDGVHYDYQGIGDFLLTRSTVDQFDVQVRTRPWSDWPAATIMSEAAATLCNHNVTFDIDRAGGGFVWLDGSPLSLSIGSPVLTSGGCEIDQVSANDYRLIWNTGEVLEVINQGTYLDLSSQLSWLDLLGSMQGLLSSDDNPDGWRVAGAASLFSPVPEPSTLTLLGVGLGLMGIAMMRHRAISPIPL